MSDSSFDAISICKMAAESGLLPALHWGLAERGLLTHLDPELRHALEGVGAANRFRNERVAAQAWEVARLLRSRGVDPLFVKSAAALMCLHRPTMEARTMSDIDIIVPPDREEEAGRALVDHGYEAVPNAYAKSGEPAAVDLRTSLLYGITFSGITEEAAVVRTPVIRGPNGERARVLDPTVSVLHHFVHSEIHHEGFSDGVIRHATFFDVTHCSGEASDVDWQWIWSVAVSSGFERELSRFVRILDTLYGWNPLGRAGSASPSLFLARTMATERLRVIRKTSISLLEALRNSMSEARLSELFGSGYSHWKQVRRLLLRYCQPSNIWKACSIHYRAADWRRTKRRIANDLQRDDGCVYHSSNEQR